MTASVICSNAKKDLCPEIVIVPVTVTGETAVLILLPNNSQCCFLLTMTMEFPFFSAFVVVDHKNSHILEIIFMTVLCVLDRTGKQCCSPDRGTGL